MYVNMLHYVCGSERRIFTLWIKFFVDKNPVVSTVYGSIKLSLFLLLSCDPLAFRHVNVCTYVCGQIAFVLCPQAYTQMSASCVELMQVTNALTGEALSTAATQSPNNNSQLECARDLSSQEMDPLT